MYRFLNVWKNLTHEEILDTFEMRNVIVIC
jgi:hypothetical protein